MNRRLFQHIAFWLILLLFFSLITFLWDRAGLLNVSQSELINIAYKTTLLDFVPMIIFSYYLVYIAIKKIEKTKESFVFAVLEIIFILGLCIFLGRVISNYLVIPLIYHGLLKQAPLLEPRRVFVVITDIGLSAGALLAIKLLKTQLALKDREKYLIKQKLETELKFLKNQIRPHFLMNTLNNIYALARKKSEDTPEVVMKLSELLRFMLYESDGPFISLSDEIKILEDYLELEIIRYNNRVSISFIKEIDSCNYQIKPLVLLPFVENAFKHGISESIFDSFIHIETKAKNNQLHFSIENTRESVNGSTEKNIGLINIRRQLELTYSDYNLDVKESDNTFTVNLFLNLNSHVEI